ncbi:3509_t:CDS:2 [Funneliformis caledonium]|uniref:3509_t:CDS:1 n=1 Tax=Funneliformis caledonium TaxID=1117310 RepID=A0A9N8ZNC5_9GLOM|nr:3509_t:CDS:2 [Funneliformis caledonium]
MPFHEIQIALILNGDKSNAESTDSNNTFITYEDPVLITPRLDKEEKKIAFRVFQLFHDLYQNY